MKLRTVGVSAALIVVVCAIYGFLIWSGIQADKIKEQELNITSLQDNVAELSKVQRIVQEGLSQDVRTLADDVASVSTRNRELILDLSEKVDSIYEALSARLLSQADRELGEVRALHLGLQERLWRKVDARERIVAFIPEYAAYLVNRLSKGVTGR